MKKFIYFCMTSMFALSTVTAHGQAVDSTGLDKLSGVSGRVDKLIPAAVPGPAGPAGPAGSAADVLQGTMCGLARYVQTTGGATSGRAGIWVDTSCQGYKIIEMVLDKYLRWNAVGVCPAGFALKRISYDDINNGQEGSTNSSEITTTYSCLKT